MKNTSVEYLFYFFLQKNTCPQRECALKVGKKERMKMRGLSQSVGALEKAIGGVELFLYICGR